MIISYEGIIFDYLQTFIKNVIYSLLFRDNQGGEGDFSFNIWHDINSILKLITYKDS